MKYRLSQFFSAFKYLDKGFLLATVLLWPLALAEGVFAPSVIISFGFSVVIGLMRKDK